jgi:hypothetical protein
LKIVSVFHPGTPYLSQLDRWAEWFF